MNPFKLKKEFVKDYKIFGVAQEIFGTASECVQNNDIENSSSESTWKFFDDFSSANLTIKQFRNSDQIQIHYNEEIWGNNHTISFSMKNYLPDWKERFDKFIKFISKPWQDWSQEELMADPMWIYYFHKENSISDKLHNAMVLFSYEDANNKWVKRYFDENKEKAGCGGDC